MKIDYIKKLEQDYTKKTEIDNKLESAETKAEKSVICAEYQKLNQYIKSQGEEYLYIYNLYCLAKQRKNKHISIDSYYLHGKTPAEFVKILRKYGIEVFTFSTQRGGMVDDLAEFLKAGCEFCGIVEIFSDCKRITSDNYEKENAILLYIKW